MFRYQLNLGLRIIKIQSSHQGLKKGVGNKLKFTKNDTL